MGLWLDLSVAILIFPENLPSTIKDIVRHLIHLGFEEFCSLPLTPLLLPDLANFSFRPENLHAGVSSMLQPSSWEAISKTLKTKIEATTNAFTNHDRLLQHILDE